MKTTRKTLTQLLNEVSTGLLAQKECLDIEELSQYANLSLGHIYKLTSSQLIPHYKPHGKKVYFKRSEIDAWLFQNKVSTNQEIEQKAISHLIAKEAK